MIDKIKNNLIIYIENTLYEIRVAEYKVIQLKVTLKRFEKDLKELEELKNSQSGD